MKLKDLLKESFEGGKVYSNPFSHFIRKSKTIWIEMKNLMK